MPRPLNTTAERKKKTPWKRFLRARRWAMIAVPLVAAMYALAFCIIPGLNPELGCHLAPLAFLTVLFWGAAIIAVVSLIARVIIRDREPD
jgi:hypothetical protein